MRLDKAAVVRVLGEEAEVRREVHGSLAGSECPG